MSVKLSNRSIVESAKNTTDLTVQPFNHSTIVVANRQRTRKINSRRLKQIGGDLLAELKMESAEMGVNLVGTSEIIRLNEAFVRHAGPTDVIAFDYGLVVPPSGGRVPEGPNRLKPGHQTLHGEIFICVDEAVAQARRFQTTWQSEVVRYLVHGVLHLLGHDDRRAVDRRKMKREENRLVRELSRRFPLSKL